MALFSVLRRNLFTGSLPLAWLQLDIKLLLLNNNNMTAFDLDSFPLSLNVLTVSCQNSSIITTRRCPNSFNTSSLLRLNQRATALQVIDVQNTTAIFSRTPTWRDQSGSVKEVEKWGGVAVASTLAVLSCAGVVAQLVHVRKHWRVSPKTLLAYLDRRSGVRRSAVVGSFVLVAIVVAVYFAVVEVWTYRYASQVEDAYTGPFEAYDMTDEVNFTFALSLGGRDHNETLTVVSDPWYTQQRNYLGFDASYTERTRYFSTPVGWSINGSQLQRRVVFKFNLSDSGGFNWTLGATSGAPPGSVEEAKPPLWEPPQLRGAFSGVRQQRRISFEGFNLNDLSGYQVPNRRNASSGNDALKSCLTDVSISVIATPFNVSVEEDAASGTHEQRYQTYLLTEAVESQGSTQQAVECKDTTISLTVTRKDFMVNRRVRRTDGIVSLLSKLLGAAAGVTKIVGLATSVYEAVVRWWKGKKSHGVDLVELSTVDEDECSSWGAQSVWNRSLHQSHASLRASHESMARKYDSVVALVANIESRLRVVEGACNPE